MARAWLTRRALLQLDDIDRYSTARWGKRVAGQHLADVSAAIDRVGQRPSLLRETPEFSRLLRFHRIREHLLVCDVIGGDVFVLAVMHGSMNLPERIAELEPRLAEEARFLHDRIVKEQSRG